MPIRLQDAVADSTHLSMEYLLEAAERVPADRLTWQPMEKGRSVLDMVQECGRVNSRWAEMLRSGKWTVWPVEQIEALKAQHDTFEKAVAFLRSSTEDLCDAIRSVSDDRLDQTFETPWLTAATAHWIQHCRWHMAYHEGQINYIQTLYGDWEM